MNNFTSIIKEKFIKAINNFSMLENTSEIVVGFSGGADSVCLLHILHSFKDELDYSIRAVHINHGIRGDEAKADADFAEAFCNKLEIPFTLFSFDCIAEAEKNKESLEECGRRVRYESFNKMCNEYSKIATAHNANDNVETIIFNITRGSSVKGLRGIPLVRDNIIRPLLYCTRYEIEGYCRENNLQFVTDSTNNGVEYTRNKIRHLVLPVLEEINSSYIDAFTSLSEGARDIVDFVNENVISLKSNAQIKDFTYDREILLYSHKALVYELFSAEFFRFSGFVPDNQKIHSMYNLLHSGGRLQLYGDFFAESKKDYFRFYKNISDYDDMEMLVDNFPFNVSMNNFSVELENFSYNSKIVNQICDADMVDYNSVSGKLVLRTRRPGDDFTFVKRNVTKSLKKLFTEDNVPIELRNMIPVLSDDIGVVWVYGYGVNKRCCVSEHTDNIIIVRGKNNDK